MTWRRLYLVQGAQPAKFRRSNKIRRRGLWPSAVRSVMVVSKEWRCG